MKHLITTAFVAAAILFPSSALAEGSTTGTQLNDAKATKTWDKKSTGSKQWDKKTTDGKAWDKKTKDGADKQAGTLKDAANKNCPVSGQPVGSMQKGSFVVHNGYKVGLCCDGCKTAFKKNADELLAKALEDGGKK